jgi:ATP phosphoribosyltransferase
VSADGPLRFALPTGDLREPTAAFLSEMGLGHADYAAGSRTLRLPLPTGGAETVIRVFRERDIPIQVALGNYDLGICGLASIEELRLRFPQDAIEQLLPLPFGYVEVWVATDESSAARLGDVREWPRHAGLRVVSDLPTLADAFALAARLPRARVTPIFGSAEAYPPEDADLALVAASSAEEIARRGLRPLMRVLAGGAWLIANRRALAQRDLGPLLGPLLQRGERPQRGDGLTLPRLLPATNVRDWPSRRRDPAVLRLAVPDGHQQRHAVESLSAAGLEFDGYSATAFVRRPSTGIPGLEVKVIRPQDMPRQVALGYFDLAMTGRDVLRDHLLTFPDSPVQEALDLRRSPYGIAAVVDGALPAATMRDALAYWRAQGRGSIRIASEFAGIADHYARTRHFGRYQVLPVAGASEGFVPEDAEVLIEGSETGASIRANGLKIIDQVFDSTNCLIAGKRPLAPGPAALLARILEAFRRSLAVPAGQG